MAISKDELAFFDEIPKPQNPSSNQQESFFDQPVSKDSWYKPQPERSFGQQLKNANDFVTTKGGAGILSLPRSTAEIYRYLAGKVQGYGENLAAKEGRELTPEDIETTSKFVNYLPDLLEDLGEKAPWLLPSYEQAENFLRKGAEVTNPDLPQNPETPIEKAGAGVGHALPVALFPGSAPSKLAAIGTSAATEALDLSESNKTIANMGVPVFVDLLRSILSRRYVPPSGEAEAIYNRARGMGYTDEELAPIMATEGQIERNRKWAAGQPQTRNAFQNTREALGRSFEQVQGSAAAATPISYAQENRLLTSFRQIRDDIMNRSHALSPQEQRLVDFLTTTIADIQTNGTTGRQLINSWRSVNGIQAGRTELRRMLGPIEDALRSSSPELADNFVNNNRLYQRFIENIERINPSQFTTFVQSGDLQALLGSVFSGDIPATGSAIARILTGGQLKRISSAIITNPQAQSLWRNFQRAVTNQSPATSRALAIQLKEFVRKELPEDYKKIDWDEVMQSQLPEKK